MSSASLSLRLNSSETTLQKTTKFTHNLIRNEKQIEKTVKHFFFNFYFKTDKENIQDMQPYTYTKENTLYHYQIP